MKRERHTPEHIVTKLCENDAMVAVGQSLAQVARALGFGQATFNHWQE